MKRIQLLDLAKSSLFLLLVAGVGLFNWEIAGRAAAAETIGDGALFSATVPLALQQYGMNSDSPFIRSRAVTIHWDALSPNKIFTQTKASGTDAFVLNLFDDAVFRAIPERVEVRSPQSMTWLGRIEGVDKSQVTFVVESGVMAGNVHVDRSFYQVRYVSGDQYVIRHIDPTGFPPEGDPIAVRLPQIAKENAGTVADNGTLIDVVVVYTPGARAEEGGTAAMSALINLAVTETNTALSRSNVVARLRLVHQEEVAYTESGDFETDLNRLTNPSDGFMDNVHSLRNTYGADLVSLIAKNNATLCGLAWLMDTESHAFESFAFSIVSRTCATGPSFTFGHELGHNMGLQHDRLAEPADGVFPYSHGYVDVSHGFRTMLGIVSSCPGCIRIQNYSNPNVSHNGFSTGVSQASAQSADAAASINAVADTLANFRTQVVEVASVDFDGDGKSDVTIYRSGAWFVQDAISGAVEKAVWTGYVSGEIPTPGDYDGDGVTDLSTYRNGAWLFFDNTTGALVRGIWTGGVPGDVPVPGDYDGDGKTDIGIYRQGAWLIFDAFTGALKKAVWTGYVSGEIPTPGDYDGDGITDLASYRNGAWLIFNNTTGALVRGIWTGGVAGDVPVAGDYDGDGKTDIGIYRGGAWIIQDNVMGAVKKAVWTGALAGEKPTPGDYDGDGITDLASYRNGAWLIFNNTTGALIRGIWTGGVTGDIPVSAKVPTQ